MRIFKRNPSYIGIYDNVLTRKECEKIIKIFEHSPTSYGKTSKTHEMSLDNSMKIKKSIELKDCKFSNQDYFEISDLIHKGINLSLSKYYKNYHDGLFNIDQWALCDEYNIQKYEDQTYGHKMWHTEQGGTPFNSHRMLVWSIYLNDAKSGTEFKYYPTIDAKEGRCVIWPASWTHLHKSEENKGLKYLATGWFSFVPH